MPSTKKDDVAEVADAEIVSEDTPATAKSNILGGSNTVTPMEMVSQAVANGADVTVLERLMDLQERYEANNAKRAYNVAISEARSEIPVITKTGEVDYTNNRGQRTNFKHETMAGIAAVIDPILAKHGLSYRFRTNAQQGFVIVTCIISHEGGYQEETSLPGPMDTSGSKNAYQAMGSALTYLQRYTLKAALGLSSSNDDDAMSAAPRGDMPPANNEAPINQEQQANLAKMIADAGLDEGVVLAAERIGSLAELPASKYTHVEAMLKATMAGNGGGQ